MKKRILSILLAVLMLLSVLPVTAMAADGTMDTPVIMTSENTDGPKLKKTAQWENKNAGIAKITMEVWGEPSQQSTEFGPTDIVLVVDCSGSMLGTRIEKAKTAARDFVEQFLGEKGTESSRANVQIGVVTYNKTANRAAELSNSKDELNNKINTINATYDTGTNIQAGIHTAQTMLGKDTRTGVAKYMIVLSDGEPTYSYRFDATVDYVGCTTRYGVTHSGGHRENFVFQPNYDKNKIIGSGSGFYIDYNVKITKAVCTKHNDELSPYVHPTDFVYNGGTGDASFTKKEGTNNGVATIWEANQAKANGTTIYSIGFGSEIGTAQNPNNAYNTMVAIASSTDKYKAASENDVSDVFDAIATEIKSYTAYNAVVTDPMGAGFTVIQGNTNYPITVANGETTSVDANGNLVWDVAKELDENHHTITFYIQYDTSTASNNNNPLPTNNGAQLTFKTDKEGNVSGTPVTVGNPELPNPSKKVSYNDGYSGQYTGTADQYQDKYYWPTTDVTIADDLTSAAPDGYEFDGWYRGDKKATTFSMPEQDVELVAHWKKTDETRQLTITKNWAEESKKADSVTIAVKNGNEMVQSVTLNEGNNWSATVSVPKYSYNDTTKIATEINYSIEETGVNGTNSLNDVDSNGVVIGSWSPSYGPSTDTSRTVTNTYTAGQTYGVTYRYVDTENNEITDTDVLATKPTDNRKFNNNNTVAPMNPTSNEVTVSNGKWTFNGWDAETKTVDGADVTFTGTWTFVEANKFSVTYKFEGEAPKSPAAPVVSETFSANEKYTVLGILTSSETKNAAGETGEWTFNGWTLNGTDVTGQEITITANTEIVGKWTFTPKQQPGEYVPIDLSIDKTVLSKRGTAPSEWFEFEVYYYDSNNQKVVISGDEPLKVYVGKGEQNVNKKFTIYPTVEQMDNWPAGENDGHYGYVRELNGGTEGMSYATTPIEGVILYTPVISSAQVSTFASTLKLSSLQGWADDFYFTNEYTKPTDGKDVTPAKVSPQLNRDDHVAYIMGYPDGNVRPEGEITRAEACTIFFRLLTKESRDYYFSRTNDYTDVSRTDWFNNAISTLSNAGIVTGYNDGTFRPDQPITRGEMAKIIANFARLGGATKSFTDLSGHWAKSYVELAAGNGWIAGYPDGTFGPDKKITRAETVTMINRVLERVPAKESRLLSRSIMLTFPDNEPGEWYYIAIQEASNSHTYQRSAYETAGDEMWLRLIENVDWTKLEK